MSDEVVNADATQLPATPPVTPEGDAAEVAQQEPKFITEEEFAQRLAAAEAEMVKRLKASQTAQIKNRFAEYDRMAAIQEKAGSPIPPEAQAAAKRELVNQALTEEGEEAIQAPTSQPDAGMTADEAWQIYVGEQIKATFEDVGARVEPGDPEWARLDTAFKTEKSLAKLLRVVAAQAAAKKDRVASDQQTAAARVGAGGGSPAGMAAASASEYWQGAYRKK